MTRDQVDTIAVTVVDTPDVIGSAPARRRVILNRRAAAQADLDWVAWGLGLTIAAVLRVDFDLSKLEPWGQLAMVPIAGLCQLLAGWATGLYAGRWRAGSFEEVAAVTKSVALATPLVFGIDALATDPRLVPLSAVLGGSVMAFVLMCGVRYGFRLRDERANRPSGDEIDRVVVVGAGEGAAQVVTSMLHDVEGRYLPVALLDDDPEKANLRIKGVPVVGRTDAVAATASRFGAATVLIAIPSASREVIARITRQATDGGLLVKVLPSVRELIDGSVDVRSIRDLRPTDLLGRHEISTDLASIAGYLRGKRVLVTGAGGSIGSELCRQISEFAPAELLMLDRDESALHAVQLSLTGRAMLDTPDTILADIRDRDTLERVFQKRQPNVVFHAAALKHLPMLEQYPAEGCKTNVAGTLNVLELAAAVGVDHFVNVSTDKAADPISVLGYTKRIAERLTANVAERAEGTFLSVRFGNVLGSRGSVLDTFTAQVEAGGPVTVTDPEITRFFMTISEACQLVIQAGAIGGRGEVLVLDMGTPVRIADVAAQLIAQSGRDIEVVFTGLRPGEKQHERLLGTGEVGERRTHPLITHVPTVPLAGDELAVVRGPVPELVHQLSALAIAADVASTRPEVREQAAEAFARPAAPRAI